MDAVVERILRELRHLGIEYDMAEHPAAHSIEDCQHAQRLIGALIPKNLFLAPRNQSAFYLCLTMPEAAFRTADVSRQVGSSRLSFGAPDRLLALLHTYPGAVSPLGLVFPEARAVRVLIDQRLKTQPRLAFHPNDNTKTLAMSGQDFFEKLLPATGHEPDFIQL